MAFFSKSNFLAPFHNKIHIVTIVLVAIVFVVFRTSGGNIESTTGSFNDVTKKIDSNKSFLPKAKQEDKRTTTESSGLESQYFFKNSRKKDFDLNSRTQPKKNKNNSKTSEYDDILNSL